MRKFRKKIMLEDRVYHSPDGEVPVDADRRKHWEEQHKAITANGVKIPIYWGHNDDPLSRGPVFSTKSDRVRLPQDSIGWLTDVKALDDGGAEIEIEIKESEAANVESNLVEVSPVLFKTFTDGKDNQYEDIFGGVDLVHYPVDGTQTEFEFDAANDPSVAVACSLRMSLEGGELKTYRLADESEKDSGGKDKDAMLKRVIEALAGMDIILQPDTTRENFLERVEAALLTAAAITSEGTDEMEESTAQPSAALSLERDRKRIEDLEKQLVTERKARDAELRVSTAKRLSVLLETGRCTPKELEDSKPRLDAVRMNRDDNGTHQPGELEAFIAAREAVPEGTFWSDEERTKRLGALEEAAAPDLLSDQDMTPEQINAEVDRILGVRRKVVQTQES